MQELHIEMGLTVVSLGMYCSDKALKELKATVTQCVICGSQEKLVVDHSHKTGNIRGLLCNHCNRGLGHFRDDPMLLEFAAQYLYASVDSPKWHKYLNEVEKC
jgi:hypothetical protein